MSGKNQNFAEQVARAFKKMAAPMMRRIENMVVRGVITAINDSGGLQSIQGSLTADEVQDDMERVQQYGFTSCPPLGSEFVAIFRGGRDHPLIIAVDSREHRKTGLEDGDSCQYTYAGNFIRLTAENGKIYIDAPHNIIIRSDETVRIEGKKIELHATEKLKVDVEGRGYDYLPDRTNTFEQGSVSGSSNPIGPPEHGTPPAD